MERPVTTWFIFRAPGILVAVLLLLMPNTVQGQYIRQLNSNKSSLSTSKAGISQTEVARLFLNNGYWIGPTVHRAATLHFATIAFQRAQKLPVTGVLTHKDLKALRKASPIKARTRDVFHVEVDLSRQLLFLVTPGGRVQNILPVTSGNGKKFTQGGWTRWGRTPVGAFTAERKIEGWHKSPLGMMYFPVYFRGGVAIHGSRDLPKFPSTHGCVAIPWLAAEQLSSSIPIGTPVLVYRTRGRVQTRLKGKNT